jgi:osmotically-inducible protein OsmY
MKTRIAAALASLLVASMGTAAYAQGAQQTTPQTTPPTSTPYTNNGTQSTQPMYNNGTTSDSRTEQQIKQKLTANGITATNVNITFNDGTATLSGTVATQQDIAKARTEALRVQGVKHVDTSNLQARADNGSMQH